MGDLQNSLDIAERIQSDSRSNNNKNFIRRQHNLITSDYLSAFINCAINGQSLLSISGDIFYYSAAPTINVEYNVSKNANSYKKKTIENEYEQEQKQIASQLAKNQAKKRKTENDIKKVILNINEAIKGISMKLNVHKKSANKQNGGRSSRGSPVSLIIGNSINKNFVKHFTHLKQYKNALRSYNNTTLNVQTKQSINNAIQQANVYIKNNQNEKAAAKNTLKNNQNGEAAAKKRAIYNGQQSKEKRTKMTR